MRIELVNQEVRFPTDLTVEDIARFQTEYPHLGVRDLTAVLNKVHPNPGVHRIYGIGSPPMAVVLFLAGRLGREHARFRRISQLLRTNQNSPHWRFEVLVEEHVQDDDTPYILSRNQYDLDNYLPVRRTA